MSRRKEKIPENYQITPDQLSKLVNDNLPRWQKNYKRKRPTAGQALCARLASLNGLLEDRWVAKNANLSFYAASGVAFEDELNRILKRAKVFIATDYKLPTELFENTLDVGGIIDTVFKVNEEDIGLLEIKTIASVEAKQRVTLSQKEMGDLLQGEGVLLTADDNRVKDLSKSKPKPSHKAQLETYSAVTGCDNAFVILISRNVVDVWDQSGENLPSISYHPIDISNNNLSKRIASLIYAQKCVDNGYVAEKPKNIKKSHCSGLFCEFIDKCYGNENFGLTLIPTNLSNQWKRDSFDIAQDYISRRPQRYERFKEICADILKSKR